MSVNTSTGPCAWHNCAIKDCIINLNPMTGKRIHLPSCDTHRQKISELHSLYKQFAELTVKFDFILAHKASSVEQVAQVLSNKKAAIKSELQGRMKQTSSIKPMYADAGHLAYMKKLMEDLRVVDEQLQQCKNIATSPSVSPTPPSPPLSSSPLTI